MSTTNNLPQVKNPELILNADHLEGVSIVILQDSAKQTVDGSGEFFNELRWYTIGTLTEESKKKVLKNRIKIYSDKQ